MSARVLMKVRLFLFTVPIALLLAACGGGGSSSSLRSDDVAVVGGQHISKSTFDTIMAEQKASLKAQGRTFPKAGSTAYASLRTQVLSVLVQNAEFDAEANKLGITVTDKDVQTQLDQIKQQYFGGSDKRYKQQLVKQGYTDSAVREQIRTQLLSQRLFDKVTADVKASDDAVHAYYVAHKSQYPPSRDVNEILVGKNKKALADSIYKQLKGGADFGKLAKKYSQDPGSKDIGGKFTAKKGQDVPEFDAAVFSPKAKTGTLLEPVETKQYGWFVIKLVGDIKPTSEASVAETIRAQLEQQDRNAEMTDWVKQITKGYCNGRITYQVGYEPSPDPCAALATATNTTSTTG
jgi:parvulin-like peptidyl-prolyl isomerase